MPAPQSRQRRLETALFLLACLLLGFDAQAAPLLTAPNDAPKYRLSNLRVKHGRGNEVVLTVDYVRERGGAALLGFQGRTSHGSISVDATHAHKLTQRSGQVSIGLVSIGGNAKHTNYELYVVMPADWAGKSYGFCKVSNSATTGLLTSATPPEPLTDKQLAAYEKNKLVKTPPPPPESGYEDVTSQTTLVPGMRVKAGRYGEWVSAEVITPSHNSHVGIRYLDQEWVTYLPRDQWLAAKPSDVRLAEADPSKFRASMRTLPGGRHPLPRDAGPLAHDLTVPPGAPVLHHNGKRWETVYTVEDQGVVVTTRYKSQPGELNTSHKRTELAIRKSTINAMNNPTTVATWAADAEEKDRESIEDFGAARIKEAMEMFRGNAPVTERDYPIKAAIPPGWAAIPRMVKLAPDTVVAYCSARKWRRVPVVRDEGDGIVVRDKDMPDFLQNRIAREQLIVKETDLGDYRRRLIARSGDLKKTLHTWTDVSGQHKVEAFFVRMNNGQVALKTESGRVINLPLNRLSENDRNLLEDLPTEADNPFE